MTIEGTPAHGPTRPNWRRWTLYGAIGIALAMQAWLRSTTWRGVIVTTAGETTTYRPSPWWLAILAVPAVLMGLVGLAIVTIRNPLARLAGGAILLVVVAFLVAIPRTIMEGRLIVTPERFTHTAGFWWNPDTKVVAFDSLKSIEVLPGPRGEGRSSFLLRCRKKDGETLTIPESTDLKAGLTRILIQAARRGVAIPGRDPVDEEE